MGIQTHPGYLLAVVLIAGASIQAVHVGIEPSSAVVFEGKNISILCRAGVPLTFCRISLPYGDNALSLSAKTKPQREFAYYGTGLENGQCGITLFAPDDKFNGEIKCTVGTEEEVTESSNKMNLVVARTPRAPEMVVSPSSSSRGSNDYREGDILQATCIVREGRPAANITWYLGNDVVGSGIRNIVDYDEKQKLYTVRSNLTRKLSWKDNNRELRCVAGHIALGPRNQTGKTFNVRYAPRDVQMPIEQFGFTLGKMGVVTVIILASPQPILKWIVGNIELSEGERDPTGKLEAMKAEFLPPSLSNDSNSSDDSTQGHGKWKAVLIINEVAVEDVGRDYYLKARNSEGDKTYRVVISTASEPQGILGAGAIIGIVIAVLVLLLIIILLIFARTTGRWCFAGAGSPKHDPRESSDTESADHGSLEKKKKNKTPMAHFFKKKNDKVSADPEDIKAVPMDDEKEMLKEANDLSLSDDKKDVVYAELDLQLTHGPVVIREDEKTEYAEIIHSKPDDRQ